MVGRVLSGGATVQLRGLGSSRKWEVSQCVYLCVGFYVSLKLFVCTWLLAWWHCAPGIRSRDLAVLVGLQ